MSGDDLTTGQPHIGEKTLVALNQDSTDQFGGKAHGRKISINREKIPTWVWICCTDKAALLVSTDDSLDLEH